VRHLGLGTGTATATAVAVGGAHTCALLSGGTVKRSSSTAPPAGSAGSSSSATRGRSRSTRSAGSPTSGRCSDCHAGWWPRRRPCRASSVASATCIEEYERRGGAAPDAGDARLQGLGRATMIAVGRRQDQGEW